MKKILASIKKRILACQTTKQIPKYKYIHIMMNDKFNKPYVDFLNRYFDASKHLILCKNVGDTYPLPEGPNVIVVPTIKYINLLKYYSVFDKIICHSLFDKDLVDILYKHKKLLNKAYWIIWGGDLYNAQRDEKNDYVRKNFKGYLSELDKEYAISKYDTKNPFYRVFYTFPVTIDILNQTYKNHDNDDNVVVQINNSCDRTTLEVLEILSQYKYKKIKVYTIVSYGEMEYKNEIINKGNLIFGKNFIAIENYMNPKDYAQHLAQCDILILNQQRQQGFGNTLAALYLGIKVFIRGDITTYFYLLNDGVSIYDTRTLKGLNYNDFIKYDNEIKNKTKSIEYFSEASLYKQWKNIFEI